MDCRIDGGMVAVSTSFTTIVGRASFDKEVLCIVVDKAVLWIPMDLEVQLIVCAHMKEAGYRGVAATLQRL